MADAFALSGVNSGHSLCALVERRILTFSPLSTGPFEQQSATAERQTDTDRQRLTCSVSSPDRTRIDKRVLGGWGVRKRHRESKRPREKWPKWKLEARDTGRRAAASRAPPTTSLVYYTYSSLLPRILEYVSSGSLGPHLLYLIAGLGAARFRVS